MSIVESISIVQAGLSGPTNETFRTAIAQAGHLFRLEAIATASHPELVGSRLGSTALQSHPALEDVPIISLEDAVHNTDAQVVFSGLSNEMAAEYEDQLASGRWVGTNAGVNRMRPDVALFNAYIPSDQLQELSQADLPGHIIANGNCMSVITTVPVAPLVSTLGVKGMHVETLQGWSGKGLMEVPKAKEGDIEPIFGDEASKIETEPNKFMGSMSTPDSIDITADPKRGPWVRGHYARVTLDMVRPTSKEEVLDIWRSVRAPESLHGVKYGDYSPKIKPVKVSHKDLLIFGVPNSPQLASIKPMRAKVHLLGVGGEDNHQVVLQVSGDNLGLGAAGSSIMNIVYARKMGYL